MTNHTETTLIWVDLETTGLDPASSQVLEVAAVATCTDLSGGASADEQYHALVSWGGDIDDLNAWVRETHTASGLMDAVAPSNPAALALHEVDQRMAAWLDQVAEHNKTERLTLAGSTPSFDMAFLERHLPLVQSKFHYRLFDVSTLKQAYLWWSDTAAENDLSEVFGWDKEPAHRAQADIQHSLAVSRALKSTMIFDLGLVG